MVVTYEDVNPAIVENTTMQKKFMDGVFRVYTITANDGYVLHDKEFDDVMYDDITGETTTVALGYRRSTATCAATYDFAANPREFYAVLETEVPADQIFGGDDPEHEVM